MIKKNLKLTEEQKQLLRKVWLWFVNQKSAYLSFGGYAGTGKTTMLAFLRKALKERYPKLRIAFCAYTGKASRVLAQTLKKHQAQHKKDSVSTIHSLIYEPQRNKKQQIIYWKKKKEIKKDLIIVDEASMLNRSIWQDLLSFKTPILAVGDHGQLPPIHGEFNLMKNPHLKLERIHRQAEDNPIIQLSKRIRQGKKIPFGNFGTVTKLRKQDYSTRETAEKILENFSDNLMVLVGFNKSRVQLNKNIRELNNFYDPEPQKEDRIICLKNNFKKGIYNGMLGRISKIKQYQDKQGKDLWYKIEAEMEDGNFYSGKILKQQFNSLNKIDRVKGLKYKQMGDLFDFGYCLTVHKAQGSQAEKVLLFEQRFPKMDDQEWRRWLYTAVTRAQKELVIIG